MEVADELGVFRRRQAQLENGDDTGQVVAKQGRRIEPQTGEDIAVEQARGVGFEAFVAVFAQYEPVDRSVPDAPYHVLANSVAAIGPELVVQIIAGAAGSHLDDQFGCPRDAFAAGPRLSAAVVIVRSPWWRASDNE